MTNGKTWLVTRHPGAVEWMRRRGVVFDEHVSHLDTEKVSPGDTVTGTLPANLAARVCARGARYLQLSMDVRADQRGKELSACQLEAAGAVLTEYFVEAIR